MGCWNKTCGLSGLYISAGTPVYVFVLEKNPSDTDRCYTTSYWKPLLLPFESEYNDYGGGENSHGVALPLIMDAISKNLVDMDVGDNQYHDIAVKCEGFGETQFFESVHETRLFRKGSPPRMLDFVMFRKDFVDAIINEYKIEKYIGNGKGNTGYENNYIEYGYLDILADIPKYLDRIASTLESVDDATPYAIIKKYMIGSGVVFSSEEHNLVHLCMIGDDYRYCRILRINEMVVELVEQGKISEVSALLTENIKAKWIDRFMNDTRKVWIPAGHEGSQDSDHEAYRFMIKTLTTVLDAEDKEREEWGD